MPDFLNELGDYSARGLRSRARLAAASRERAGCSPRDAALTVGKMTLYRYRPQSDQPVRPAVLIVYALVNRPDMADLEPGRSLIEGLLKAGLDVWLVDWGYPDGADRGLGLADYVLRYLDQAVDKVAEATGKPAVNMLGVCQGGVFSLCYSALFPDKVANLITTVTPVDFHTPGDTLSAMARHVDLQQLVASFGNMPGDFLNMTFLALKPFQLMLKKYADTVDLADEAAARTFMRMEKWIFDSPAQSGRAFAEFVEMFYQRNALVRGEAVIDGRAVDLRNITAPVLNIYARHDHLVPPPASRALADLLGPVDYTELEFPGGHIGIYVSGKSRTILVPAISGWLFDREGETKNGKRKKGKKKKQGDKKDPR